MRVINKIGFCIAISWLIGASFIYAEDAPVEDLSTVSPQQSNDNNATPVNNEPVSNAEPQYESESQQQGNDQERLERLEQQQSNIIRMNLPQQIDTLRQEIQQLTGRLQVQEHDIKLLENQQRSFYQDLNRRIQHINDVTVASIDPQKQTNLIKPMANTGLKDSSAYRLAFNALMEKKYNDALSAFQTYIHHYPQGAFIAHAYYWVGELYLKKKEKERALQSFARIVSQYPHSNKVPDAQLKLAMIHLDEGQRMQARQLFQLIKQKYPETTAAQLASIQLQRMS